MNCQDIFRLVDVGNFGSLGEAERRAADAHASTCPHCAPLWGAHAQLARQRMPAMPAGLAARMQALAAAPASRSGGRSWRRLTVVGSIVALAAAASILLVVQFGNSGASGPAASQVAATAVLPSNPAPQEALAPVVVEPAVATATPDPEPVEQITPAPPPPLPLLPVPVHGMQTLLRSLQQKALQMVADEYPETVEGPELEGTFIGTALLRENGTLAASSMELVSNAEELVARQRLRQDFPDGAIKTEIGKLKNELLADGRKMRATVRVALGIVSNDYDLNRSLAKVVQAVKGRHSDAMTPMSSPPTNLLTVFLSDDGHVVSEKLEAIDPPGTADRISPLDTNDAALAARQIAEKLEIDASAIGLMGRTYLEEGAMVAVIGTDGSMQMKDDRKSLEVQFAWARRSSDSGPTLSQPQPLSSGSTFDPAVAQRIVEQVLPDAFTLHDPAAGDPVVVLTAKGELIRAGRVDFRNNSNRPTDTVLQEQLVPGVRTNMFLDVRLQNNLGETATVTFAWEVPEEVRAAMDRDRAEREARQAAKAKP